MRVQSIVLSESDCFNPAVLQADLPVLQQVLQLCQVLPNCGVDTSRREEAQHAQESASDSDLPFDCKACAGSGRLQREAHDQAEVVPFRHVLKVRHKSKYLIDRQVNGDGIAEASHVILSWTLVAE